MKVILLGPQRRPTLDAVVATLGIDGPIATVTAGWQEREADDGELGRVLGGRDVNLRLYGRWLDVQDRDPSFAAAERKLAELLMEVQGSYLLRLDYALQAVHALQQRNGQDQLKVAIAEAIEAVRDLDAAHLRRTSELRGEFYQDMRPHDRPVIAGHRAELADALGGATAVAIAGGHVGVLADALHLFNIAAAVRSPVIAWSAGAMALTERVVLFHDRSAHGPGYPEVYCGGLSIVRETVALPHARARLLLEEQPRMAVFARRFAPARCVLLESGTRIDTEAGGSCQPGARILGLDGRVTILEAP